MTPRRLVFRVHALERMSERGITPVEVRHVIETGVVVEDYPTDTPYPSRLLLGFVDLRPLHVVVADNLDNLETIVITAYEPDPGQWDPALRRRQR